MLYIQEGKVVKTEFNVETEFPHEEIVDFCDKSNKHFVSIWQCGDCVFVIASDHSIFACRIFADYDKTYKRSQKMFLFNTPENPLISGVGKTNCPEILSLTQCPYQNSCKDNYALLSDGTVHKLDITGETISFNEIQNVPEHTESICCEKYFITEEGDVYEQNIGNTFVKVDTFGHKIKKISDVPERTVSAHACQSKFYWTKVALSHDNRLFNITNAEAILLLDEVIDFDYFYKGTKLIAITTDKIHEIFSPKKQSYIECDQQLMSISSFEGLPIIIDSQSKIQIMLEAGLTKEIFPAIHNILTLPNHKSVARRFVTYKRSL